MPLRQLSYHCKDPKIPRVHLLEPIERSAMNKGGTVIHSGYWLKPGTIVLGLNRKSKAALRNRLSDEFYNYK